MPLAATNQILLRVLEATISLRHAKFEQDGGGRPSELSFFSVHLYGDNEQIQTSVSNVK